MKHAFRINRSKTKIGLSLPPQFADKSFKIEYNRIGRSFMLYPSNEGVKAYKMENTKNAYLRMAASNAPSIPLGKYKIEAEIDKDGNAIFELPQPLQSKTKKPVVKTRRGPYKKDSAQLDLNFVQEPNRRVEITEKLTIQSAVAFVNKYVAENEADLLVEENHLSIVKKIA